MDSKLQRYIRVNGHVYEHVAADESSTLKRQPSVDAFINLVVQAVSPAGYRPVPLHPGYEFYVTPDRAQIRLEKTGAYKIFYWRFFPQTGKPNTLAVQIESNQDSGKTGTIKIAVDNPSVAVMAKQVERLVQKIIYELWNF